MNKKRAAEEVIARYLLVHSSHQVTERAILKALIDAGFTVARLKHVGDDFGEPLYRILTDKEPKKQKRVGFHTTNEQDIRDGYGSRLVDEGTA